MRRTNRVAHVAAGLRRRCRLPADSDRRGPVLLDRFLPAANLLQVLFPDLSSTAAANHRIAERLVSPGAGPGPRYSTPRE